MNKNAFLPGKWSWTLRHTLLLQNFRETAVSAKCTANWDRKLILHSIKMSMWREKNRNQTLQKSSETHNVIKFNNIKISKYTSILIICTTQISTNLPHNYISVCNLDITVHWVPVPLESSLSRTHQRIMFYTHNTFKHN